MAVAPEREDLGVVDQSVDHRRRGDLVAEIFPEHGLLEVTIIEARSSRAETELKIRPPHRGQMGVGAWMEFESDRPIRVPV